MESVDEPVDLLGRWRLQPLAVLEGADVLLTAEHANPHGVEFRELLQGQALVVLEAALEEALERFKVVFAEELLDLGVCSELAYLIEVLVVGLDAIVDRSLVIS